MYFYSLIDRVMNGYKIVPFLVFIFILFSGKVKADSVLPDSIITRFNSINDNVERVNQTRKEMRRLAFVDFDMAIELADFNIQWANSTGDTTIMAKAISEKSILYLMTMQYKKAKPFVRKGIVYAQKAKDSRLLGYSYRNLGVSHYYSNALDSGITNFFLALNILDTNIEDHKLYYGLTCEELGKAFYESSNNAFAEKYATQALKLYSDIGDSTRIIDVYTMLALTNENSDTSIEFLKTIMAYSLRKGDSTRLYNAYANYGNELVELDSLEKAKSYSLKSYRWFQNFNQETFKRIGVNLANIYINEENFDSANFYLDNLIPLAIELEDNYVLSRAYSNKVKIEKFKGNHKKALEFNEKSNEYALLSLSISQDKEIKAYELEVELQAKDRELSYINLQNEVLENKADFQKKYLIISSVSIIALLILLVFLWYTRNKLKQNNHLLSQQKNTIEKQKVDLEKLVENNKTLFSIIGHDLRSPINSINAALELIPNEGDKFTQETEYVFNLMKESIKSTSDLLENLLVWSKTQRKDYTFVAKPVSVKDEVEKIVSANKLFQHTKKIQFVFKSQPDLIVKIDPFALETIIRNIFSNAIKFSPQNANIFIAWKEESNSVEFCIEDEAGGLPEEQGNLLKSGINIEPTSSISKGMGLKLIKSLCDSTNTKIDYQRTEKGSRFIFHINKASE